MKDSPDTWEGERDPRRPGVVVLLYHRVTRLRSDPHRITVNPDRFSAHVDLIGGRYEPVSLRDLLTGLERGRLPRRGVCITFDDGYADNLEEAAPLLAQVGLPATVFVATECLDGGEFWWDQLEHLFLTPGPLPSRLRLRIAGRGLDAQLGPDAYGAAQAAHHADWSARSDPPPTERHRVFQDVFRRFQRLDRETRAAALDALWTWADRETSVRASHRPLSAAEIAELADIEGLSIGSHTVSHPRLSKVPRRARSAEIHEARARLEEIGGEPVLDFAYPFGDTAGCGRAVRGAGIRAAYTTLPGAVRGDADPLRLPRVYVGDWPAERLEEVIETHLETTHSEARS